MKQTINKLPSKGAKPLYQFNNSSNFWGETTVTPTQTDPTYTTGTITSTTHIWVK